MMGTKPKNKSRDEMSLSSGSSHSDQNSVSSQSNTVKHKSDICVIGFLHSAKYNTKAEMIAMCEMISCSA